MVSDEIFFTKLLEDHLNVGSDKCVSYLPIATIVKLLGVSVEEYCNQASKLGHNFCVFGPEDCCINSGAVYVYCGKDLVFLLEQNRQTLHMNGWPIEPCEFIKRIASEWLEVGNKIMPVIKRAFGDQF